VSLVKRIGNEPVVLNKEAAGFVGNRLQYALLREALWIVQQGIAVPEEVDRVMTLSLGRRYAVTGPFATADLGGLDTFFAISNQLMPQLASDNSPLEMMERIVSAGNTGSKSGRGFLDWPDERIRVVIKARNNALLQRRREERREAKENLS
jgi:3-hydroxybutyryl-CoA dehydrogenase